MNIFNKVTLKSLQKNKVRTGVTIIGIALSAAMICAVTTSIASFQNFLLQNYIYSDGSWHGYTVADRNMLGKIQGSDRVAAVVSGQYLGYAKAEGCTNPDKPYLYLMGASDSFAEMMPVHVTSGRYPKNQSEILLPNHLKSNGGVSPHHRRADHADGGGSDIGGGTALSGQRVLLATGSKRQTERYSCRNAASKGHTHLYGSGILRTAEL